jgi:hypothetical protein
MSHLLNKERYPDPEPVGTPSITGSVDDHDDHDHEHEQVETPSITGNPIVETPCLTGCVDPEDDHHDDHDHDDHTDTPSITGNPNSVETPNITGSGTDTTGDTTTDSMTSQPQSNTQTHCPTGYSSPTGYSPINKSRTRRFNTKASLRDWILSKLGAPLVDVILENNGCGCASQLGDTDGGSQLDHCIDDAVETFQYHGGGEGNERRIMLIPICEGIGTYAVPDTVLSVRDTIDRGTGTGSETLFTLNNSLFGNGNWPLQGSYGGGGELVDYALASQWLGTFESLTKVDMVINHRQYESLIDIFPTPREKAILPLEVYVEVPDEKLYNNIWVREYALAMANIQIGMNTGSITGMQFPFGGEFNYQMYFDQGQTEKERLMEELKTDTYGEPIDFFIS